ncbi:purine-nucleoside phosphorylase [Curvivirga aplysinae]|uniref:purine-nucleoside phosphorylase n=1 Tax=Curvivirga aplysinae TaxID=2529852 RepID=UPI0012BD106C|nr:purine-nucleoside phosphorylase [Curvivirga aplysinae]MTI10550.1 purine-nucleoside phosphorylase [Curvivirga aplysinae]
MSKASKHIRELLPDFSPEVAIILGSGLGGFAELVENATKISYRDLKGFPQAGVAGHAGQLICGTIGKTKIIVAQGRAHFYEHGDATVMDPVIKCFKQLGCHTLIVTNAAGGLNTDYNPGSVMIINDHINFSATSPLIGKEGNERFVGMADAYDPTIRERLMTIAEYENLDAYEGVYMWFTGPHFETPAEIRMAKMLGAEAVGMSTVPEVILARFYGMKVAGLSNITNLGAGLSDESLSHEHTMAMAGKGAKKIATILKAYLTEGAL